jgi:hypothetical protein
MTPPIERKDAPFPAFLFFFGGFGQRHGPQGPHRRHGEGQLFDVGSDAVKGIAQSEMVYARNQLGAHQQQYRNEPVTMKKRTLHQRQRADRGRHPGGHIFGQAQHAGGIGLNEILVPEQTLKWRGQRRTGHKVEHKDFLLL